MTLRDRLRPAVAATALLGAVIAVPHADAAARPVVGSASVYGLDKHFTLVGHTDLGQRGMNSPLAIAGHCAYVGDRYYSDSPDVAGRPHGGIAIVDISKPAQPRQVGAIAPTGLSTQRELRADTGLGILVV